MTENPAMRVIWLDYLKTDTFTMGAVPYCGVHAYLRFLKVGSLKQ